MSDMDLLRKIGRLKAALKRIAEMSKVDISLDPDKPRRIAREALERDK